MHSNLPPVAELKAQAKRLRQQLSTDNPNFSHGAALEAVAKLHGFANWNTLRAIAERPNAPRVLTIGDRVAGVYLKQPFEGVVRGVEALGAGHQRLTIVFDEPVDVVTFDSFSAFRSRIRVVVDEDGVSPAKLSSGEPHLVLCDPEALPPRRTKGEAARL